MLFAVHSQATATLTSFPTPAEVIAKGFNNFLGAGEGKENEETLESVKGDERVPQALDIEVAGDEAHGPRETHDERQSDVQAEVTLCPAAGGETSRGRGREDHVGARGEEGDVENHHQGQRKREEHQQRVPVAEPAVLHAEGGSEVLHHRTCEGHRGWL